LRSSGARGEKGSTRAAIRRETARLLALRGYNGTSLRDIADAVGVQQASLYNHYPNKQSLVADVMATSMQRMIESVRPIVDAGGEPIEILGQAIRAHVEFQGTFSDWAVVCREELRSLDDAEATLIAALRDEYESIFVGVVERGVAAGDFASADPRAEIKALIDMWNSVSVWYRPDGRMSLAEIGASYAELALAALGAIKPAIDPVRESLKALQDAAAPANHIRAAATELIAERGFHGTSLRDLAEAAKVPSSTIYHYFPNKERVLFSILETAMVELLSVIRDAYLGAHDPPAQLTAVVAAHVRFHATRRAAALVSDTEFRSLSGHPRQVILSMRLEYEALFRSILAAGVATGAFRVADIDAAVFGLIRMCSGVASWYEPDGPTDLEAVAAQYADLSLAMVTGRA
jgi:AcrR family transcriptional regulator